MIRRVVAATCAGAAVVGVVEAARTGGRAATAPVLVAARNVESGARLRTADLQVTRWPAASVGAWALASVDRAEGRVLSGPIREGEPVTSGRLLGAELLDGQPEGSLAVHVPLADPAAAALARPGDRVDLLSTGGQVLAASAVVLAVAGVVDHELATGGGGTGATSWAGASLTTPTPGVTVSVSPQTARLLAAHFAAGLEISPVTLALRSR